MSLILPLLALMLIADHRTPIGVLHVAFDQDHSPYGNTLVL
jgi:hypothetical protein